MWNVDNNSTFVNILHLIDAPPNAFKTDEFIESLLHLMDEYITMHPSSISEPDFHDTMVEQVKEVVLQQFSQEIFFNEKDVEELEEIIEETTGLFYESIIPPRSHDESIILKEHTSKDINEIRSKIQYLESKPQPTQRTKEWYEFRHNLITASSAYKIFQSDSIRNQLIYEKCQTNTLSLLSCDGENETKTINISTITSTNTKPINVDSPLHWGQKYEPVSVMLYEEMYQTTIKDFGCIQHDKYPYVGASPDGINIDEMNPRYGRMLEIKNIVNRIIDGVPKTEYWIQMQLQMETCDLDECDFLETRFKEYENAEEFYTEIEANRVYSSHSSSSAYSSDDDTTVTTTTETSQNELNYTKYGVIMYFVEGNKPIYKYAPLHIGVDKSAFELWEFQQMESLNHMWIRNIYWKVEELSCVLVQRNRRWFCDNIGCIEDVWKIIEKERVTGYSHRAPTRRTQKTQPRSRTNSDNENSHLLLNNGCFLNISKDTGKVFLNEIVSGRKYLKVS